MNEPLNLQAGELVEIKSESEILRTLDSRGALESLPFMPEMLEFCGRRFKVYKRADKVCDTIEWQRLRRMDGTVHLEGLRCSGAAHGGCQAGCLMHWKEAWLTRVSDAEQPAAAVSSASTETTGVTRDLLTEATRLGEDDGEAVYSCQATELLRASVGPLPWWDAGQYVRDIRSGNAGIVRVVRGLLIGFFNIFQKANGRLAPRFPLIHGSRTYPFLQGRAVGPAPVEPLDLQVGELVQVRSKREIEETLNPRDRTRGLRFDREMLAYCGRRGRVRNRVEMLIDEGTGKMIHIHTDCIVIEGFVCTGNLHRFCPRSIFPYWREAWLERVDS